ncbi:MAG: hypothetical protein K0Q55_1845 [Verrucomicrobia bacterium]|nr:hypothetical protein [Verrucomicrobiota bacterium]
MVWLIGPDLRAGHGGQTCFFNLLKIRGEGWYASPFVTHMLKDAGVDGRLILTTGDLDIIPGSHAGFKRSHGTGGWPSQNNHWFVCDKEPSVHGCGIMGHGCIKAQRATFENWGEHPN